MLAAPLILLLVTQQAPSCATADLCRAQALIAHARQDHEAFHDLAWAAYRRGKSNDPGLMLLVARAQALSGRQGDALVMIERIAALGGPVGDVQTSEDFAKVRTLPRWPEVEAKLSGLPPTAPSAKPPAPPASVPAPSASVPAPSASVPAPSAKPPAPPASVPAPSASVPAPSASVPAPSAKPPVKGALSFTTVLTPTALAYDGVSKRFIIADRRARRVAVIDENSGQVSTLVGAQGALGDVDGIAIDAQQGDLWIVSTEEGRATLHRVQLISGRIISSAVVPKIARVAALAFVRGTGLVVADGTGTVWHVTASGKADRLGALEYVPRAMAADASGMLYVSAGAPRLARFAVRGGLARQGLVELDDAAMAEAPFAAANSSLFFAVAGDGAYELRTLRLR